jgi:hypothetical protein
VLAGVTYQFLRGEQPLTASVGVTAR